MPRINFAAGNDANAASTGYMESTRLSPITPKNKVQILKDYQLSEGAAKGMNDTAMSRLAAQAVLDKFVRDREEAKRIAREAEAARVAAEQAAKEAADEALRQEQAQIAAQNAQLEQEAAYQAQVSAQQAAIAARSMIRIPTYTAPTVPISAPQAIIPKVPSTIAKAPYVAPRIVAPQPIASSRYPVIR